MSASLREEEAPMIASADEARGTPSFWEGSTGLFVSLGVLAALVACFLLGGLGSMGMWEPWEASEVMVASEYWERDAWDAGVVEKNPEAPGYNWAVPTREGIPAATSLLKIWFVGAMLPRAGEDISQVMGALERGARLPIALALALLAFGVFFWVRRRFDTLSALLSSSALLTMPVIYFGAHNVSTQLLGVVTTSGALLLFMQLVRAHGSEGAASKRWIYGAGFGVMLAASFLDQRLPGLLTVMMVIVAAGVAQIVYAPESETWAPPKRDLFASLAIALSPLLWMGYLGMSGGKAALEAPHVMQLLLVAFFSCALVAGALAMRRTNVGGALFSPQGLVGLGIAAVVVGAVMFAYADVNPTLLKHGEVYGKIPVLTFALEQEVQSGGLAGKHQHFDLWLRQIGFATFPWIALIPSGLAYLSLPGAERPEDDADGPGLERRMLLVWAMVSLGVIAVSSAYGHYFFTGYVPLAIGVGVMLGDVSFWKKVARHKPILLQLLGLVGAAFILTLGKDLERYPHRFVELYAQLPAKLTLPEGFSWGKTYKPMKYVMLLAIIVGSFGLLSWSVALLGWLKAFPARFKAWRAKEAPLFDAVDADSGETPMSARARARAEWLDGEGLLARVVRLIEGAAWRPVVWTSVFVVFGALSLWSYLPKATFNFSQRHIFETYTASADAEGGEKLYRYLSPQKKGSLYLRDVPVVASSSEFLKKLDEPSRFFAVIPRERLAQVNYDSRKARGRKNVHVLDARSAGLILLSNRLEEGEKDQNFIAEAILPPSETTPAEVEYEVKYKDDKGQLVHPTFDGKLELVGYSFGNKPKGAQRGKGVPVFGWGEEIELVMYFRVLERVPSNQKLFVHIDTKGNRLHGDHYPLGGDFQTNYWLPGDIIKDTHKIPVENYTRQGQYAIGMGFYKGNDRMKVAPKSAHRGDRVMLGELMVRSL
jgi:hypothetical protein